MESGDILSSKASETKDDRPPPPMCPPGREAQWNEEKQEWECVDIEPGTDLAEEQPSGSPIKEGPPPIGTPDTSVNKAVDPRKNLQEKAREFAQACNEAVDAGVSVIEVMTIAQQTLLGLQNG